MESPEDIEKALARLVPSAISDQGQRSLEELIDSLAAGETTVVEMPSPRRKPWGWMAGAAAAAAVTLALFIPAVEPGGTVPLASTPVASEEEPGFVVLEQTKHVESAEPEDWTSEADGVTHRAWRVRVVNQERVQDLETGYEVLVSHPQDEVILQPVNTF